MATAARSGSAPISLRRLALLLGGLAMFGPFSIDTIFPAFRAMGTQFGADKLAMLSEEIEVAARQYVEIHQDPAELVEKVVELRPIFEATLAALEAEASPLVDRKQISVGQRNALGGMSYG